MQGRLRAGLAAGVLGVTLVLAGCGSGADEDQQTDPSATEEHQGHGGDNAESGDKEMDHSMEHPMDGGPAPEGIAEASDPAYPVGTEVQLTADHMEGMDGATATISGAFDTYTYSVNYTPAGGGAPVTDHKWVVQEEIEDAGDERLADGTEVTLLAEHMEGMEGATATIASSTDETVYMVDYETDGMKMTNHKWVVESEIQPAS
ncbi:YdhK family protein [Brevibacterium sp. XM4083]|uniref:YdhK family protein n=1 Tax=Brevibacterium sp. XM4083 TaxID=2583238 RepID=UPI00112CBACE|nr:YdhK family protein [Brevibacterium sp. XM4083]MCM1014385.1 YdhK family protein [Brevibacterium sp. XM4083]